MQEKLIEFANLLRHNGVRVSPAESLDASAAAALAGLSDRETFRATLRATMVKRTTDLATFEELFELYFSGLGDIIKQASQAVQDALSMSAQEFQRFLEQVEELLRRQGKNLSELARQLLRGDSGRLEKRIREAAAAVRLRDIGRAIEENYFARALARELGLDRLEREIRDLRNELAQMDLDPARKAQVEEYLARRLKALDDIIRRYVRMEREKHDPKAREQRHLNRLADKSFYYLSDTELEQMKTAVRKLAQRLKNVVAIRRKRARKGRFDIKRTLRRSLEYGGVPFKIRLDRRQKQKPQVVILCDVSDSVRNAARFMLQFVYSLQDLYSRVRSFIFVAEIGEVTEHFRDNDAAQALDIALGGDIINLYAHSNFGRAFRTFVDDYLGVVNKRTTVIVLGDARNNYNLPHDRCLGLIKQRAQRLIWLNPESRNTWGFGDSEMDRYGAHCDLAEECRNLNQLYRVVDQLLAR